LDHVRDPRTLQRCMINMPMNEFIFVDTWAFLALANINDNYHSIALGVYKGMHEKGCRIVTSDYVLDEAITALFKNAKFDGASQFIEALLGAINIGQIALERIDEDRFSEAWLLRKIYQDKPDISFTDLTSFVIMRELDIHKAFTGDRHFTQTGLGFEILPGI